MQKHSSQFLFYLLSFTGPSLHLLRHITAYESDISNKEQALKLLDDCNIKVTIHY